MVLFPAGADPPENPKDLEEPSKLNKDPPGDGGDPPGGGGDPPPDPPPPIAPQGTAPAAIKGTKKSRPSMKDVPLYKEGDDLIAFITSFTLYLNYYDTDPTIKIKEEGEAGYVSAEGSAKELKKHYTNPKTLLGRALQGQVSSWYLDNIQAKPITCKEEWAEVIKLFQTEFALDGQTQLGRVVKWHRLSTDKYPTFMEFIHEVQKTE